MRRCIEREERGVKIGLNHQSVKTNGNWMSSSLSIAFLYSSPERRLDNILIFWSVKYITGIELMHYRGEFSI